ncbi:MAG: haloacid dehalogenase [SAR202 cluster bacterium]|nr:haloacid dehalogenase [Chloroflexota bacterium]MQG50921.1 haloacid dehalogenase [SAR202 cluster bacterium]|tara:strand:+ start:1251 stop:2093 length:843 start_codon:yes stop_codon:yes gene_type:complete
MKVSNIPNTNIIYLIENYEALLFDAYGVLLNEFGVLPGAINLIDKLNNTNKPYFILTNDASRSVPTSSNFYKSFGLEIPEEKIITAGSLIYPYFQENNLKGSKCRVIGTDDCFLYVADAGGIVSDDDFDVLIIGASPDNYTFSSIEDLVNNLFRMLDVKEKVSVVLLNPDLLYPKSTDYYGIGAGSILLWLESFVEVRYPGQSKLQITRLGKPFKEIYQEAFRRTKTMNMVMVGDQLQTDIVGANNFGIDSVLVHSGLTKNDTLTGQNIYPSYTLSSIND